MQYAATEKGDQMPHHHGYAGNILKIDLSTGKSVTVPTEAYADRFLGGRGIAARIHWEEVPPKVTPFDPENRLVFMTGPVCGVPGLAGSRWQATGKSPATDGFCYANFGGSWGAQLKFAGYDGVVIHGKADGLVSIVIDEDRVELRDAPALKGKGATETREILKENLGRSFRIVSIGPAGEHGVSFATLLADSDSSGSAGLGAVMGSKGVKAIAVRGQTKLEVADEQRVQLLRKKVRELRVSFDILPGSLPRERFKKDVCFGCIDGCIRATYSASNGSQGKFFCQPALFYEAEAQRYSGKPTEVPFHAARLCDSFGLDTRVISTMIMWLRKCYQAGILTETQTALRLSKIGSMEFIEALVSSIASRNGFGDVLAQGTNMAAKMVGQDSERLITDYMIKTGENSIYSPRLFLTTALFYATEPRMPIQHLHEISMPAMAWAIRQMGWGDTLVTSDVIREIARRFWGGEMAADFSTYEGKAMAATRIQNRGYAKESLILCDYSWPITYSPATEDHVGDSTLESQICAAVTGRDIDEEGLYRIGERVFNLQRAILTVEGRRGRANDTLEEFEFTVPLERDVGNPECIVPGPDGNTYSRKGMVLDRDDFERMKDEYYRIRGWDTTTGLQTRSRLHELDLDDIVEVMDGQGLLA